MRIPVEVRPDFIEKVARRTDPLGAVEELVCNSLDANATEVRVELELDDFGGVQAVIVSDNGHGISSSDCGVHLQGNGRIVEADHAGHRERPAAAWPPRLRTLPRRWCCYERRCGASPPRCRRSSMSCSACRDRRRSGWRTWSIALRWRT
ncbi:hypothetical protein CP978_01040 [Streptomyces nodosus]|uniref:Histidine kinase/HSP90-like ATPase domain-containing protein n=1 Tax=Streptomyces nodosus TaxID=40318 RepID=A0A5P2VVD1_9ACTN|nr:hypothetical protein CP978_01040 [Streptomyces nodosus]